MDKSQNSANGSSKVDLIKDESESENTVRYGNRSASSQIMVAVAQNFLLVAVGMAFGMPTMILGALNYKTATNQTKLESPDLILDDEQSSWLGSGIARHRATKFAALRHRKNDELIIQLGEETR
ncbi:hypothetical protein M8J77_009404 [Diaphorina citri]|nr:hypothetical protein M8J77_009404 [Diaphorina citri]